MKRAFYSCLLLLLGKEELVSKSICTGKKLDYIFMVLCPTQTEAAHKIMHNILNLCVNAIVVYMQSEGGKH